MTVNHLFAYDLLFTDPFTGEELRPSKEGYSEGDFFIVEVENKAGTQRWKHSIKTEEL